MSPRRTKFMFITGGVVSSLGKGIAAASIGCLLESRGLHVTILKCDPYINVDPGTMNPYQHGEVYVTNDGAETDLDLGHYERFTSIRTGKLNNVTTGQIYHSVILKERAGGYHGGTVQVVPHITDEIKKAVNRLARNTDVVIVEIGGTVGDIESQPFLEAIRQFGLDHGRENMVYIHVTLVPYLEAACELKTKPTQHSVRELRAIGIQPDILLCRTNRELPAEVKRKIALFCNVDPTAVITARDMANIYRVPLSFAEEGLDELLVKRLRFRTGPSVMDEWNAMIERMERPSEKVKIAVVGKYTALRDAYKSLNEAFTHAATHNDVKVHCHWIESEDLEGGGTHGWLEDYDGLLIPGGFGIRGIEGKIGAIHYARTHNIPFFGICLGMQCAVIEFARDRCGCIGANSTEFNAGTPFPIIHQLPELAHLTDIGGTLRLGSYPCRLEAGSNAHRIYGRTNIDERHRHRYEVNTDYRQCIEEHGLVFSGASPDNRLMEIVELKDHRWFLGCQFHPEFKSHPLRPHPLFIDFVKACKDYSQERNA
ncbi:CTP synthase [bacterium]|nr:CTP synthase [candidate division CSSED10-310 bacterium]